MNKVWGTRRTKRGLAQRQYGSAQRQLRRMRKAGLPLPHVVTVKGVCCTLTVTIGPRDDDDWEDEA